MFYPKRNSFVKFGVIVLSLFAAGCATYYQNNIKFSENFVKGDFNQAARVLDKNKSAAKGNDKLLYFLQKGVVEQLQGNFEESNRYLEKAYLFTEDIGKNYAKEAFSLLSNPTVVPYKGEDFEVVLIHYYKALNYLSLNQYEEALVECRRINIKLNQINDKYEKRKNRYKRDAFAYNLMGIIFEAAKDYNNAFISYRNAYEAYEQDYKQFFEVETPLQLKKDLLRTAYLNGFTEELAQYEKIFGMKYTHQENEGGELIFFWNNGLGPVKDDWNISFFIVRGKGELVTFVNKEYDFSFPFMLNKGSDGSISDLKFVRVAFPKYLERKPYYRNARIIVSDKEYPLELAQNINEIAFKTLEDRMIRELANSLLRLAFKQAAEKAVSKKAKDLGTLLSIVNVLSEKSDTRNWQTLPYSISYARIPLPSGENTVEFKSLLPGRGREKVNSFKLNINKGETIFRMFHTLDSIPLQEEKMKRRRFTQDADVTVILAN